MLRFILRALIGFAVGYIAMNCTIFASAQVYSGHSTFMFVERESDDLNSTHRDYRQAHLVSLDGITFSLHLDGCEFEVDALPARPTWNQTEDELEAMAARDLAAIGWDGKLSFLGVLRNPHRDITRPVPDFLACDQNQHVHFIAVSPANNGDALLKRTLLIIYQWSSEPSDVVYYFVPIREDVLTQTNLRKFVEGAEFVGELARALAGAP
jgi:hypothetical protein